MTLVDPTSVLKSMYFIFLLNFDCERLQNSSDQKCPLGSERGVMFHSSPWLRYWTRHVHGSQNLELDPDLSGLDPGSQETINDLSLSFVERSTRIIDPTNLQTRL